MTAPASPPPEPTPAEQEAFLQALLAQAFKPSSPESTSFLLLSSAPLVPDSTTARDIGLAAAFGAVRRFLCDEFALLGGGWAEWMVQPEGGDEILACCVRYAQDAIHTFLSYAGTNQLKQGDYAAARETARAALVRALVRTGDLVGLDGGQAGGRTEEELERAREGWGRRVWLAEDEGSILEIPHLSPSLLPTPTSLSLLLDPLEHSPFFSAASSASPAHKGPGTTSPTESNPPPHTPADSPLLRPIALPSSPRAYDAAAAAADELDEGEKTPTNRSWALPPLDAAN